MLSDNIAQISHFEKSIRPVVPAWRIGGLIMLSCLAMGKLGSQLDLRKAI